MMQLPAGNQIQGFKNRENVPFTDNRILYFIQGSPVRGHWWRGQHTFGTCFTQKHLYEKKRIKRNQYNYKHFFLNTVLMVVLQLYPIVKVLSKYLIFYTYYVKV